MIWITVYCKFLGLKMFADDRPTKAELDIIFVMVQGLGYVFQC